MMTRRAEFLPTRRQFLPTAAAAVAVPSIVSSSVFGSFAPSNRITMGVIGCGNQSTIDLPTLLGHDDAQVLAVCDVDAVLIVVPDQSRNFLDCVKSRKDPIAKVEVGHRTATFCHLGNIAMLLKRKIRWDPEKEEIVGDAEAAKMLSRPLRAPWTLWG